MKCHKFYDAKFIFDSKDVPKCSCGSIIKPDVVLYEETLNNTILNHAIYEISQADLLIVAGTSLTVYPAASLLQFYQRKDIILINKEHTSYDNKTSILIQEDLNEVFSKLKQD